MLRIIHVNNCITIRREENPEFNPAGLIQTVTNPNPRYHQNERLGFSNYGVPREICLAELHPEYLSLPRGCMSEILKMYPDAAVIDETILAPIVFKQSRIILKEYQRGALNSLMEKNQGILWSPPGSGKTIVGIELIIKRGQKTLVLVHTLDLLKQWQERFGDFTGIEPGIIQGDLYEIREVTIGMIQSLCRPLDRAFTSQFGMVLLDEAHHAPATTFQQLVDQFPARYRYGLTATPTRQDGLEFIMTAVLGPVIHQVEKAVLIENGSILKPKIKVVQTNSYYSDVESYQELLTRIVKDEARNLLIVDLVAQEANSGHYCLVLSERVCHVQELHSLFTEQHPDIKALVITGQDSKETRQQAIAAMNQGTGNILFSTKLADEGLDIRRLDRLFLTCPVRAVNKVTQQIGRIQRTFPGKQDAAVFDFLDINSLAESQFYTREQRIYSAYEIEHIQRSL
jgi:superfamily II DNA or RNA helicase